jgi:hypothetical protein
MILEQPVNQVIVLVQGCQLESRHAVDGNNDRFLVAKAGVKGQVSLGFTSGGLLSWCCVNSSPCTSRVRPLFSPTSKKLSTKRLQEIRRLFQEEKPTPYQLIANGDMEPPVSQTAFVAVWQAACALKRARRDAGLTLSQVAKRGGLDKATLSRLEAGQHLNPIVDTLSRSALALGRSLALSFPPLEGPS